MAKKKITQLDLFSGIGGFHLGFEKAGFKVKSYFSEIDKHAIAVYKHQFKNAEYVGSVINIDGNKLPRIDLITFGSPCQDFSLAGKRKGMGGERSSLVLEAIRLIDECRPSVFVWENVKGTFSSNNGADFAAILQAFANIGGYRLEWQLLNTNWVLPQTARECILSDILQSPEEIGEEYYLSERSLQGLMKGQGTPQMLER
jgi:DNA (cytosine-5)-methyltransferase 1